MHMPAPVTGGGMRHGSLAAVVHCYYPDLAPELALTVTRIPAPCDVFVSTDSHEKADRIGAEFRARGLDPHIRVFPNRGWDIAAFVVGFADVLRGYELCLKIHGKRSPHYTYGSMWREFLLAELAYDVAYIQKILLRFADDPRLGMLAPAHWRKKTPLCAPSPNHAKLVPLLARMGVALSPESSIDFPGGSMFWCRTRALRPLLDLGLAWEDFSPTQDGERDFTLAHAVERAFFYSCGKSGLDWEYIPKYSAFTGNPYSPRNCLSALLFLSKKFVRTVRRYGFRHGIKKAWRYIHTCLPRRSGRAT